MALQGTYLDMPLYVDDLDHENLAYFGYCAQHDFHLQRCLNCDLFRYPPGTACPWCSQNAFEWAPVEAKGTVHSYGEVHHAIQPSFREHTPYMVLLVELDTQRGVPTEHEALRIIGNLVMPNGDLAPPEVVKQVGIGTRVRMVYVDAGEGLAIPQWAIDTEAEQPEKPWRYAEE